MKRRHTAMGVQKNDKRNMYKFKQAVVNPRETIDITTRYRSLVKRLTSPLTDLGRVVPSWGQHRDSTAFRKQNVTTTAFIGSSQRRVHVSPASPLSVGIPSSR
jgi:hypothetical protein